MFTKEDTHTFHNILRETKTKIEMIGPPSPRDIMQASTQLVIEKMQNVEPEMVNFFHSAAEKLVNNGESIKVVLIIIKHNLILI